MGTDAEDRAEVRRILADNPAFAHVLRQFAVLYDAAEVLEELEPLHHDTAALLRAIGDRQMRGTGIGEDFLQAMIRGRPSIHPSDAPNRLNH